MRKTIAAIITLFLLSACGGTEEVAQSRPDVSYADIQPAAGMTYPEFRKHKGGSDDMLAAQKRFMILDRDNNGRLSPDEFH